MPSMISRLPPLFFFELHNSSMVLLMWSLKGLVGVLGALHRLPNTIFFPLLAVISMYRVSTCFSIIKSRSCHCLYVMLSLRNILTSPPLKSFPELVIRVNPDTLTSFSVHLLRNFSLNNMASTGEFFVVQSVQ